MSHARRKQLTRLLIGPGFVALVFVLSNLNGCLFITRLDFSRMAKAFGKTAPGLLKIMREAAGRFFKATFSWCNMCCRWACLALCIGKSALTAKSSACASHQMFQLAVLILSFA